MTFQIWSSMTEAAQQDHMSVNKPPSPSMVPSVTKWAAFLRGCFYNLSTGHAQHLLCATGTYVVKSLMGHCNWNKKRKTRKEKKKRGSCPVHRKGYTNYKLKKKKSWLLFCQGVCRKDKRSVSQRSWKRSYMKEVKDSQDKDCEWKLHDGYLAEHWLGRGWELWANQTLSLWITVCPLSTGTTSKTHLIHQQSLFLRKKQPWNIGLKYWPLSKG